MISYTPEDLFERQKKETTNKEKLKIFSSPNLGKFQLKIRLNKVDKTYDNCSLYHLMTLDNIFLLIVLVKLEEELTEQEHIFARNKDAENWVKLL